MNRLFTNNLSKQSSNGTMLPENDDLKTPTLHKKAKRKGVSSLLIYFAILYAVVFSSTISVHNVFTKPLRWQYEQISFFSDHEGNTPKKEHVLQRTETRNNYNPLAVRLAQRSTSQASIRGPKVGTKTSNIEINMATSTQPTADLGELVDPETITSILKKEIPFPSSIDNNDKNPRLRFRPGGLNITHEETLRHCYTDPTIYKNQFPAQNRQVTPVSDTHQLIYMMIPKSGSSTGRWIMENVLDADDEPFSARGRELMAGGDYADYTVLTFVRDPLSRFYSSYDEVFLRYGPWFAEKKNVRRYAHLQDFDHPFPYLYENMTTWLDFQHTFCPPSLGMTRKECLEGKTHENGTLAGRFERFVWDYDGLNPFDLHLRLQVPHISNDRTGRARRVDEIYTTENAIENWEYIAEWYGKSLPEEGQFQARSIPRRFDSSFVSLETKRRICKLAAIDYCCLNLQLPPECEDEKEVNVYCALDRNARGDQMRIQPWYFPHQIPPESRPVKMAR